MKRLMQPLLLLGRSGMPHQQRILNQLSQLNGKIEQMALNLDRLTVDITNLKTIDASVLALITSFVAQLKDLAAQLLAANAANDPVAQAAIQAQIDSLSTDLEGEATSLSAAVAANTPPVQTGRSA